MEPNARGSPAMTVHRWSRPPQSCKPCRAKKRRCDRNQPCSSCSQRGITCEYASQGQNYTFEPSRNFRVPPTSSGLNRTATVTSAGLPTAQPASAHLNAQEVLYRLRKLEEAVFSKPNMASPPTSRTLPDSEVEGGYSSTPPNGTPFSSLTPPNLPDESYQDTQYAARLYTQLPPIAQARQLFHHFAQVFHPTFGVLHIPFARNLMEQTYQSMLRGEEPDIANLLLLFSIFAGAALSWTPQLLERLGATQAEAKTAFKAYTRLGSSILGNAHRPLDPSTTALAAILTLAYVLSNSDGLPAKVHLFWSHCLHMARTMQVHRIDTAKSREERRLKECNMIEIEMQRRVWWYMVASDWLGSFSEASQEGTYMFQPKHMNVNYPSNADDESITPMGVEHELPLSVATDMSAFIQRLRLAEICREIVDITCSNILESQEPDYGIVLALDDKLQSYIKQFPVFLRIDSASIPENQDLFKERPQIVWQGTIVYFGAHVRLCKLHRWHYLEGLTNHQYAYSRTTCIRSAHKILQLRRSMDDMGAPVGLNPARFWIIMQHVFTAALTLATDVSFNPDAPDAEAHKTKVLAACRSLERSKEESSALRDVIQRNMQTLMSTLHRRQGQANPRPHLAAGARTSAQPASSGQMPQEPVDSPMPASDEIALNVDAPSGMGPTADESGAENTDQEIGEVNVDQLWSEFLAAAPDLNSSQWTSLLDNMDFSLDIPGL